VGRSTVRRRVEAHAGVIGTTTIQEDPVNGYVAAMENELHHPSETPATISWFGSVTYVRKG